MQKTLKPMLAALALGATLLAPLGAAGAADLRIGIEAAYPPFNDVKAGGGYTGFDVDISNALCKKMAIECEFVEQEWDGMIPALQEGKFDAIISSMSATPERAQLVDFTNHYYRTFMSLAVTRDSALTDTAPASFSGKKIGAQTGSTSADYAQSSYGAAAAGIVLYATSDEAGKALANGEVDALIDDKYPMLEWLRHQSKGCCKILGDLSDTADNISIAVRLGDTALRERLNEALDAIRADGSYLRISQRYFGIDIY